MNKRLIIGAAAGCAIATAAVAAKKRMTMSCSSKAATNSMWDTMRRHMEEMPADFPPRVMFDNVAETKANTEKILGLLRADRSLFADPLPAT